MLILHSYDFDLQIFMQSFLTYKSKTRIKNIDYGYPQGLL